MKSYYRIMSGAKSLYAEGYNGKFATADSLCDIDLTGKIPDDRKPSKTFFRCKVWAILALTGIQFIIINNDIQAQGDSLNYDESKIPPYILPNY